MSFYVEDKEWEVKNRTSESLKKWFNDYCEWCWGHGFGDCDKCKKYYKHILYRVKMREFKERQEAQAK